MYGLLRRDPIRFDREDSHYLIGRKIMVTGAGGSIGSALCRRLAALNPSDLIMLDRDESALHAVQLATTGSALLDDASTVLGDIRDVDWLHHIMQSRRPDIVFHAAALKHQPLLERYPTEAVKTNVAGTWNVLRAAHQAGVKRLVNVSTDKAADPCCALGASKRIAERLVASYPGGYVSVRFGNVLGSRGSVLETFAAQLRQGLPVTVTSKLAQRFFMTVDEAIDLVIRTGKYAQRGTAYVMPVPGLRIVDLARRLAAVTGTTARITYTGMRSNERVAESLTGVAETMATTGHPSVYSIDVPALPAIMERARITEHVGDLERLAEPQETVKDMIDMCGWRAV